MDRPQLVAANLARNLVALRHVRNLTQGALAKAAGVPRSTISNLESSSGNPSLTVLVKVASALGVPLDELLASPRAKVRKWTRDELGSIHKGASVRGSDIPPLQWTWRLVCRRASLRSFAHRRPQMQTDMLLNTARLAGVI